MQRTLPNLFEESVKRYPNNVVMWEKTSDKYGSTTYKELQQQIHQFAAGLLSLGLVKGDRVALISEGRNDWVISELAILYCGAINVPISVKIDELNDLKFRLLHSECKFVIVSLNQLHKIQKIKQDLPYLEKTIILDSKEQLESDEILKSEIYKLGKEYLLNNKENFEQLCNSILESDYANICYTSGTTADPKGIILTHRNYTANVEQSSAVLDIPEWFVSLLILPWDHSFAHTAGIYTLIQNGASMASVQVGKTPLETLKNIPVNIKETKPTFLLSVPAIAKNFRKNIEKGIKEKGAFTEKLYNYALKIAYEYNKEGYNKGEGLSKLKKPLLTLFDKILFSKIRENFGGRLQFFIGGGALLDIELQRYFYALGIPMFQGYGLSEAAPVISANVPIKHKLGSSGAVVKDLKCKICDSNGNDLPIGVSGEIVVKGENVMAGYWKNEKATTETIKDGWLYTGDMGYLDKDNFLYVLGRFKSLLIGSDGEKYSPEGIEEAITEHSKFIDQIMLYNNQSQYTVALIVPNKESVKRFVRDNNLNIKNIKDQEKVLNAIDEDINAFKTNGIYQDQFPQRWIPASFAILGEGFTEQNKFLNSTMKMVRGKITDFYKSRLDFMYTADGKPTSNSQNLSIISKLE